LLASALSPVSPEAPSRRLLPFPPFPLAAPVLRQHHPIKIGQFDGAGTAPEFASMKAKLA